MIDLNKHNEERLNEIKQKFKYWKDKVYVIREGEYIKVFVRGGLVAMAYIDAVREIPNIKLVGVIQDEPYILFEDKEYNWKEEVENA